MELCEGTFKVVVFIFYFSCPPYNPLYLLAQNLILHFRSQHQKTILQHFAIFMTACNIVSTANFVISLLKIVCLYSGVVSIDYVVILDSHIY